MPPHTTINTLSDGCTLAPDLSAAVYTCCVAHDAAYAVGGTWAEWLGSNLTLGACIAATDHAWWALPFAIATTVFGWVFWGRKKKQGPDKK